MTNQVTVSIWQLLGFGIPLLIAWNGFLVWVIKKLLERYLAGNDGRIKRLEERLKEESQKRDSLERDFLSHLAELPQRYVQREDWIRLATSIDAKMDKLNEKLDAVKGWFNARSGY